MKTVPEIISPEKNVPNGKYSLQKLQMSSQHTWSSVRSELQSNEKRLMGEYFALHDFLVPLGSNPELVQRDTVASILVNQGTTPNIVVEETLKWVVEYTEGGTLNTLNLTWHSPGAGVATTLQKVREAHTSLRQATYLFLFPGLVDFETEAVSGPEAVAFAEQLDRCFTYAFLSVNTFDMNDGTAYFAYSDEVGLQAACANRYASHKFLFLDSTKFKREGRPGYTLHDLLSTAEALTIYTVSSSTEKDDWIKSKFKILGENLLDNSVEKSKLKSKTSYLDHNLDKKILRLRIIGQAETSTYSDTIIGYLRPSIK